MRKRALTLIEIMVSLTLMVILTAAIAYAFAAGLDAERRQIQRQTERDRSEATERYLTQLLMSAKLTDDTTDATTFFLGETVGGDSDLGCDRLTFTTTAPGVPLAVQADRDDFETQQQTHGPIGGVAEISLGTTPMGEAGDRTGLFERIQRPSDGDTTQGGTESVRDDQIERLGFQFYNGQAWTSEWNTVTGGERRLPAAVMVSYVRKGDAKDAVRRFIVPLPTSDVDSQNPVATGVAQ